ncbi:MAG TPA: hypothetical protein VMU80_03080 [Bryobacteraceae bacterium]|nr:hypothetical protein [Bryobacteraceae bacterium]
MFRFILVIAFLATSSLLASDFSGRWAGVIEMNNERIPFYLRLSLRDGMVKGLVSSARDAPPKPISNSELRDDTLSFEIRDAAKRLVHFRLTLTSGILGGKATVGSEIWRVALVPVDGGAAVGRRYWWRGSDAGVGVGGAFRVGGHVSASVVFYKVEPSYTEWDSTSRLSSASSSGDSSPVEETESGSR